MKTLLKRLIDAKSGIFAVLQTALANVVVQAANVGCGILTARALGPSGRGSLAATIMWPQFLAYALACGFPTASMYWMKKRPEIANSFTGAALVLCLITGLAASVVGIVTIPFSLHTYPAATIHFAQMVMIFAPLVMLGVTMTAQVQVADNFKLYNLYRILSPLSVLVVLFVEKLTHTMTPNRAGLAYLLAGLPATLWITMWVVRHYRPNFKQLGEPIRTLVGYGLRAWGGDLLGTVANQIDRVLVVSMLSPEAMGLYVVAQSAANVLAILPGAVAPVTLPRSSGLSTHEIMDLTGRAIRMTLLVMLIASLPLFFAGSWLLKLVYGGKFTDAGMVLPFLVVETIIDGMTFVLAQAFLAAGFPSTVTLLQGVGLVTSIPLLYWLIPVMGLRGAGCALMLGTSMRLLCVLASFPLRMKVAPPNMLISKDEILTLLRHSRAAHSEDSVEVK